MVCTARRTNPVMMRDTDMVWAQVKAKMSQQHSISFNVILCFFMINQFMRSTKLSSMEPNHFGAKKIEPLPADTLLELFVVIPDYK